MSRACIFRRGSGDLTLMRLALQVLELALRLNLDLNPIWVSRADPRLQKADAMTKHVNTDDWSVHSVFLTPDSNFQKILTSIHGCKPLEIVYYTHKLTILEPKQFLT
jgi:hypothetical protein